MSYYFQPEATSIEWTYWDDFFILLVLNDNEKMLEIRIDIDTENPDTDQPPVLGLVIDDEYNNGNNKITFPKRNIMIESYQGDDEVYIRLDIFMTIRVKNENFRHRYIDFIIDNTNYASIKL
jgi:hypothetical protein